EVGDHRLFGVEQALVHVDVEHLRAALDLLSCDDDRLVIAVVLDQFAELRTASDVGALADVDEVGFGGDRQRFETAETGLAGDAHAASASCGTSRGARPRTASAIAAICAGVVPQQPPTR